MDSPVIGKRELLQWASMLSGRPCRRFEDLRDGTVALLLFSKIWPRVREDRTLKPRVHNIRANWDSVQKVMNMLELPKETVNREAVQSGKFRACYNFLVMLFFLHNLSQNHDFSVDFSHPIDTSLAEFLQSQQSVRSLVLGGAIEMKDGSKSEEEEEEDVEEEEEDVVEEEEEEDVVEEEEEIIEKSDSEIVETVMKGEEDVGVVEAELTEDEEEQSPVSDEKKSEIVEEEKRFPPHYNNQSPFVQTDVSSRRIDKLMIQHLKMKKENDRLRQLLAEREGMSSDSSPKEQTSWKQKGELLMTKMRYDLDNKTREIEHLKTTLSYEGRRHEQQLEELTTLHKNELLFQKEHNEGQIGAQKLLQFNERNKDLNDYTAELKSLEDEIAYEADRVRQGSLQGQEEDDIEQELLRLRQLRAVNSRQVSSLEESNKTLQEMLDDVEPKIAELIEGNLQLHRHYMQQDMKLHKQLIGEDPDEENSGFTERERTMLRMLQTARKETQEFKLRCDSLENEKAHLSSTLALKGSMKEIESRGLDVSGSLATEFSLTQKVERLENEVRRLKSANQFLREYQKRLAKAGLRVEDEDEDEDDEEGTPRGVWLPSDGVGCDADEMDARLSTLLALLEKLPTVVDERNGEEDINGEIVDYFWQTVVAMSLLRSRILRSREEIIRLYDELRALELTSSEEVVMLKTKLGEVSDNHEEEMLDLRTATSRTMSRMKAEISVLQEKLRSSEDSKSYDTSEYHKRVLSVLNEENERQYSVLLSAFHSLSDTVGKWKARDSLWEKQCSVFRELLCIVQNMALTEKEEEVLKLNQERMNKEFELSQVQEELSFLESEIREETGVTLEDRVKSMDSYWEEKVKNELSSRDSDVDNLRQEVSSLQGKTTAMTTEIESVKGERDAWGDAHKRLQSIISQSEKEKRDLVAQIEMKDRIDSDELRQYQARVTDLEQIIDEKESVDQAFSSSRVEESTLREEDKYDEYVSDEERCEEGQLKFENVGEFEDDGDEHESGEPLADDDIDTGKLSPQEPLYP